MNQRQLAIASVVLVILIAAGAAIWYALRPSHQLKSASQSPVVGKAAVGQRAPEFVVSTTHGLFDLDQTARPVFLEIFATWCPHCQREAAVIDRLYAAYGSRVAFVGVSGSDTGMDGQSPASQLDVIQWTQRFNVRYPVAYDSTQAVAALYLQGGFPTLCIIGKDKQITYLNSGEVPYQELASAIQKVL
ncbi:MAG TPA: TlpA disulfide reductase family protein [Candidatus Acidoferrales bacterium]|nr:TlpA disulfide reductase family protein [Candidatus Acidoferrales bacterium]